MARVFIAARLPADVGERVASVQRELDRGLADIKWVEAENLHFTLRFFGELAPEAIERSVAAVTAVAKSTMTFPLRIEGLGSFPERGRPRVIWLGVSTGRQELTNLARGLEEAFATSGLGRADRAFAPHLTLGRVRDPNARRGSRARVPVQAAAAMHAVIGAVSFEPAEFEVEDIAVVESRLFPGGPEYHDIHRARLGGTGRAGGGGEPEIC